MNIWKSTDIYPFLAQALFSLGNVQRNLELLIERDTKKLPPEYVWTEKGCYYNENLTSEQKRAWARYHESGCPAALHYVDAANVESAVNVISKCIRTIAHHIKNASKNLDVDRLEEFL